MSQGIISNKGISPIVNPQEQNVGQLDKTTIQRINREAIAFLSGGRIKSGPPRNVDHPKPLDVSPKGMTGDVPRETKENILQEFDKLLDLLNENLQQLDGKGDKGVKQQTGNRNQPKVVLSTDNLFSACLGPQKPLPPRSAPTSDNVFATMIDKMQQPQQPNVQPQQNVQPQNVQPQNVQQQNVQQQNQVQGNVQLPDFPAGPNVTTEEKTNFVMQMLREHPNATRQELEAKYTYTDPTRPNVKTGPLVFAGGGQGNVILLRGTDVVIKKNLAAPEARTYKFLNDFRTYCNNPNEVPAGLARFSPEERAKMYNGREAISQTFPVPMALMDEGDGNIIVAMKNASYDGDVKVGNTIDDIKIGSRIVSKKELRAHGNSEGEGTKWLVKWIQTRLFPRMKGTPGRGYEYVAQDNRVAARLTAGRNTNDILSQKFDDLTMDQRQSLLNQLNTILRAHTALPVTFVGSSIMLSLPDDNVKMPHLQMGDFAHSMFTSETTGQEAVLGRHTYDKYKQNFHDGISSLIDHLEKSIFKQDKIGYV